MECDQATKQSIRYTYSKRDGSDAGARSKSFADVAHSFIANVVVLYQDEPRDIEWSLNTSLQTGN